MLVIFIIKLNEENGTSFHYCKKWSLLHSVLSITIALCKYLHNASNFKLKSNKAQNIYSENSNM